MKRGYFIILISVSLIAQQSAASPKDSVATCRVVLLPDFYNYMPYTIGDTTFTYECRKDHNVINMDTLHHIEDVDNVAFLKIYFLRSVANNGGVSPPRLTEIKRVYERTGKSTWVGIDQDTYSQEDLKEDRKKITRRDTTMVNNRYSGAKETVIHKYYRMIDMGPGHHEHKH